MSIFHAEPTMLGDLRFRSTTNETMMVRLRIGWFSCIAMALSSAP